MDTHWRLKTGSRLLTMAVCLFTITTFAFLSISANAQIPGVGASDCVEAPGYPCGSPSNGSGTGSGFLPPSSPSNNLNYQGAADQNSLGKAAFARGDYGTALDFFEVAYELDPTNLNVRYNLSNTEFQIGMEAENRGDYNTATDWYDAALATGPRQDRLGDVNSRLRQARASITEPGFAPDDTGIVTPIPIERAEDLTIRQEGEGTLTSDELNELFTFGDFFADELSLPTQDTQAEAMQIYTSGRAVEDRSDFIGALAYYEAAHQKWPRDPYYREEISRINGRIGWLEFNNQNYDLAEYRLLLALSNGPNASIREILHSNLELIRQTRAQGGPQQQMETQQGPELIESGGGDASNAGANLESQSAQPDCIEFPEFCTPTVLQPISLQEDRPVTPELRQCIASIKPPEINVPFSRLSAQGERSCQSLNSGLFSALRNELSEDNLSNNGSREGSMRRYLLSIDSRFNEGLQRSFPEAPPSPDEATPRDLCKIYSSVIQELNVCLSEH